MKGGVLIIGSLLWDQHQGDHLNARRNWRKKYLQVENKLHVTVPIRYGRLSKGTYTMVLSKQAEIEDRFGTAYVVPFKNEIRDFRSLLNQAKYLSEAEGKNNKNLVKGNNDKWCVIGILFNPAFAIEQKKELLMKFKKRLKRDGLGNESNNFRIGEEQSMLTGEGVINLNWLKTVKSQKQSELDNYDFIISACPKQNIDMYPTVALLKESIPNDHRNYFYNNIMHGITTFQDREIITRNI